MSKILLPRPRQSSSISAGLMQTDHDLDQDPSGRSAGAVGACWQAISPLQSRVSLLLKLSRNSAGVVAGLAEAGPESATPATSFFPSQARQRFVFFAPAKWFGVGFGSATAGDLWPNDRPLRIIVH